MKPRQILAAPCTCPECRQAGVTDLEQVIDTKTGEAMHGYKLKAWHEARAKFMEAFRRVAGDGKAKAAND